MLPAADYEQTTLELSPGDLLIAYSDGLVEPTNSSGEEYGEKRLRELLTNSAEKSPAEIRQVILASLADFSATLLLRDDLAFVVVQFGLLPRT
jgi:serine phosphatase RsbU (regulator of sigma subunit)